MSQVEFILGGYERGGTTLLSEIFRANGYESGFECGVLLGRHPSEMPRIQPYWDMLLNGWKIDDVTRKEAIRGDFDHFYRVLTRAAFPNHSGPFFDKTPKYMEHLGLCLNRAPFLKGAVIIHRDPRAFFVSAAKRLAPNVAPEEGVDVNFKHLADHYLSYFIGSIAHLSQPNVLFVPFEELVSREDAWLKTLGMFAIGKPFQPRQKPPRFVNVTSSKMDLSKIVEFDEVLSRKMQERILDATRLAAPFFASPVERARFGDLWEETIDKAKRRLKQFDLPAVGMVVEGNYFEPLTYLIRYPDILKSGVNPVNHYRNRGIREKRIPA
ncbi:sulfotransferase family protein [Albidovulum inexpectatum]|uniref:Sulfotransferase family protein n=1 Tax=Albidovulum inexpectatum TaxID=196587 RepID=A0A2S5JH01_9RHOB|nr:sulfotransferase [Albidovulum inexpectatum]PPB80784.1 sulfotransferase family protein [Albidovulum inexpectatum]